MTAVAIQLNSSMERAALLQSHGQAPSSLRHHHPHAELSRTQRAETAGAGCGAAEGRAGMSCTKQRACRVLQGLLLYVVTARGNGGVALAEILKAVIVWQDPVNQGSSLTLSIPA